VYDAMDRTAQTIDRILTVSQALVRVRPLRRLVSGNIRSLFPADTYETMLAEDFVPAGVAQSRKEGRAVAVAIPAFREQPPPPPGCPTIVLSAARSPKGRERQHEGIRDHQRRYAENLPSGRFESVDSGHFIQAERPQVVAESARQLLSLPRITRPASAGPPEGG